MPTKLQSVSLECTLFFEKPVRIDNYPAFVIRSILGYHLRRMHCVSHGTACHECAFKRTCAYIFLFESIIDKNTSVLPGRDRASQPFRIICNAEPNTTVEKLSLEIWLYGKAVEYIPHIIFALKEAGNNGLFSERVHYKLEIKNNKGNTILDNNRIKEEFIEKDILEYSFDNRPVENCFKIQCITPVRFKVNNKYTSSFSAVDFYLASFRRINTLFSLYSEDLEKRFIPVKPLEEVTVKEPSLRWKEYKRYSRRQKTTMRLGGIVGSFTIHGRAPQSFWQTLTLAEKLGVGKSTSFGFGHIVITKE
ncbi:CRISPR system precrRNA processing endoribonuclease RAMP protein Cas6 [Spirochaetia bacterium 38H-sp]|uniref:CRISPR system precrRNA processing endoribonuclease RAMP protein Cas6 n=1 Tax=Rarispira pelagica TaxID=3141764 RepID=A0ABU9U8K7_9SPIR